MVKGFVTTLELIIVLIVLIIAFGIFFPSFTYKSKWSDALLLLKGRDVILTLDRIGKLYNYSFNSESLKDFLTNPQYSILPLNIIPWSEVDGTIKNKVSIACNCTNDQIASLTKWLSYLKLNNRNIDFSICYTNLEAINPCIRGSDVLLIWGYKDLSDPVFKNTLTSYLREDNGIVEMMDFNKYKDSGNKVDNDPVQREIFGLKWVDVEKGQADYDEFGGKPKNFTNISYIPYKYFYHIPLTLTAPATGESLTGCTQNKTGNFIIWKTTYSFWICDGVKVYFDTDGNGAGDAGPFVKGNSFTIRSYKFLLSYVEDTRIRISFNPDYSFSDFLTFVIPTGEPNPRGWAYGTKGIVHIEPVDNNKDRILVKAVSTSPPREYPAVILNNSLSRVAWVYDFGSSDIGDDQKQLLITLLLWASNKKSSELILGNMKIGYSNSYINVNSADMFEVYRFSLGLGSPY